MTITNLEERKEEIVKEKILYEHLFWDKDDPRHKIAWTKDLTAPVLKYHNGNEINLGLDSYIFAVCGTRGSGKSITMTYLAALANYKYNSRILSNYPIEYTLKYANGDRRKVKSEPLDMQKLLGFDEDYHNCLILIDEAPDVISHMASMTWKNKLLNIFVRQLRKNRNSLILGAQNFYWIDKGMRWQTDVIVNCQDAVRLYGGNQGLSRGACILLDWFDNSGQWTGYADEFNPIIKEKITGTYLWDAYDTYFQQDIWESLKKVDMKLMTYKVGNTELEDTNYLIKTAATINSLIDNKELVVRQPDLWNILNLSNAQKRDASIRIKRAGVKAGKLTGNERTYNLANFNEQDFMKDVK